MKPIDLVIKKVSKSLSTEEGQVLEKWLQDSKNNQQMFDRLMELTKAGVDISKLKTLDSHEAWNKTLQQYEARSFSSKKTKVFGSLIRYAAIFLGIIGLSYGYATYFTSETDVPFDASSNIITLELGNGEIQVLSLDSNERIADSKGNKIVNKNGNILDYSNSNKSKELVYNTLKVPYGDKFQIRLSDSTLVHLNAGSSLRYPVYFVEGKNRQIFLEGEAFFDVSKDMERPFIVTTTEMDVTVFGTMFNVSAYPEDKYINTVLVEGSVGLSSSQDHGAKKDASVLKLEPGHKAEWNTETGNTVFDKVDTDIYTSWINGRLVMKNFTFKSIRNRLERRYNVEIINNYSELDNEVFTASFDIETIEEVLASFAENRDFEFESLNNKITINKASK
ncbi:MAG: FecR domain-containing protein [Flavobacteriaceae bacterium]